MKLVVFRYKTNNEIDDVSQLTDERYKWALENQDSFNSMSSTVIAEIYDTEKDNIPRDVFEYVFKIIIDKRPVKIQDIIKALSDLEDSIDNLAHIISNTKYDIEQLLEE